VVRQSDTGVAPVLPTPLDPLCEPLGCPPDSDRSATRRTRPVLRNDNLRSLVNLRPPRDLGFDTPGDRKIASGRARAADACGERGSDSHVLKPDTRLSQQPQLPSAGLPPNLGSAARPVRSSAT
jgi:hypothetical protein